MTRNKIDLKKETVTWSGQKILYTDLTDQHLSNMAWFYQVAHKRDIPEPIKNELVRRGRGRLLFRPTGFPGELEYLEKKGILGPDNLIIDPETKTKIGSIEHLVEKDYEVKNIACFLVRDDFLANAVDSSKLFPRIGDGIVESFLVRCGEYHIWEIKSQDEFYQSDIKFSGYYPGFGEIFVLDFIKEIIKQENWY